MRNPVRGFFKGIWAVLLRINAAVANAPGNWIALLIGVPTLVVAIWAIAPGTSPGPSAADQGPMASNEAIGPAPPDPAPAPAEEPGTDGSGGSGPPILAPASVAAPGKGSAGEAHAPDQCDAEYRLAMQEQLRRLIEAEIGRCATWTRDQIELHYSCTRRDDDYRIRLVRQYSGGLNGEVLRFEARYDGPRELDVDRLRIRSLTSDYRRLCAEARRRRGY